MLRRPVPILLCGLVLLLSVGGWLAPATEAQSPITVGPYVVDLPAGATVEIPVYGFCLDPLRPFPTGRLTLLDIAPEPLRLAALYALTQGYVDTDPFQTQLAIWYFTNNSTRVPGKTYGPVAEEIIAFVEAGAPLPDTGGSAPALHDAVTAGHVSTEVKAFTKLGPADQQGYYGQGTLVITSLVDFTQQILVPYGLRFHDETQQGHQDVIVFPQKPPAVQPTPTPTSTPIPTPTPTPPVVPPSLPPTGQLLPTPAVIGLALAVGAGVALRLRRFVRA